jgi:hypothetical protein
MRFVEKYNTCVWKITMVTDLNWMEIIVANIYYVFKGWWFLRSVNFIQGHHAYKGQIIIVCLQIYHK